MNTNIERYKKELRHVIDEMSQVSWLFVKTPGVDFSRDRKLNFKTLLQFLLNAGSGSINSELVEFFKMNPAAIPSAPAFVQQREKLLPQAMEYLFHAFTDTLPAVKTYHGYRVFAGDGSDINIAHNPDDECTYIKGSQPGAKGHNQLHLNAIYDILNRIYVDGIVQYSSDDNEYRACVEMIDRSVASGKILFLADRGYESYNVFMHAQQNGWFYAIRAKDIHSNGILGGINWLPEGEFDVDISLFLTRRQTKEIKSDPRYKFFPKASNLDCLPPGSKGSIPITFRVARFLITEDTYECLITNLSREEFPLESLKEVYHLRWEIETSFRELKHTIGMVNFHSKKPDYVIQEIFAKLTVYNFCEAITADVVIHQPESSKHLYQVNFTMAIKICIYYLRYGGIPPGDIETLIGKYILPVRPGRQDPRKIKPQTAASFLYRAA